MASLVSDLYLHGPIVIAKPFGRCCETRLEKFCIILQEKNSWDARLGQFERRRQAGSFDFCWLHSRGYTVLPSGCNIHKSVFSDVAVGKLGLRL